MPRFLLDENLPASLATAIEAEGHVAIRAQAAGLRSRPDEEVLAYAVANECILITQDQAFGEPFRLAAHAKHPGVIVLRSRQGQSIELRVIRVIEAIRALNLAALKDTLVVVAPGRIRVRKVRTP